MKQNIKLFFTSLISNNACIDGARKKPWYAAILLFFFSIILSVIPSSVIELQKHADKNFDSTTYGLSEASVEFSEYLSTLEDNTFYVLKNGKETNLIATEEVHFERYNKQTSRVDFVFRYSYNTNADHYINGYNEASVNYVIFTEDTVYFSILDPNTPDSTHPVLRFACINAYKKLERDDLKKALAQNEDKTKMANDTWSNWKGLIRKLYRQTRLRTAGIQLAICSTINVGVTLIMGFMIWILTRGKANPYRLFTVWDSFKIAFWATITPGVITVGLGFLIKNFASMMFPLLLGIRVMWLTMKSLRPDGSGYAAN